MSEQPPRGDDTSTSSPRPETPSGARSARRPRPVLIGAVVLILVWLVVGGLGGAAQGKLSGVQSNDNASFLPKNAESTLVSTAVEGFNDSTELPYLVVVERADGGALDAKDLSAVKSFAGSLPALALPALGSGKTLGDYLVGNDTPVAVPSQDGQAVLVSVPLDGTTGTAASGD
ncbi:MAG: hypothetical protein ABI249_06035, partial [Ornithinibacter sp.]